MFIWGNDSGHFSAESEDASLSDNNDDGELSAIHSSATENDDTSCPMDPVDAAYQEGTIDEVALMPRPNRSASPFVTMVSSRFDSR